MSVHMNKTCACEGVNVCTREQGHTCTRMNADFRGAKLAHSSIHAV
jgi:hypothetical protein